MTEAAMVRAPIVRIFDRGDATTILGPRGTTRVFSGDSAELVRAVLELHGKPITRSELCNELAVRAQAEVPGTLVDQVIAMLVEDGALVAAPAPAGPPRATLGSRRIVLAISGAVAAVDAPSIVRGLHALGGDVRIALSRTAKKFVSLAALQAITHHQVWSGIWQTDARTPVPHIALAEWAELVLVCPATATTIARIAAGDCSDLVAATVAATRAPVVIVPSMNDAMYESPAVQANLATLRDHGRVLVHPALGLEVAHRPEARRPMLGPAPPAAAIVDIVRHLLAELAPRAQLPRDAASWERLWATTPADALPWHADALEGPLADALAARRGDGARLLDLGTGAGTAAIAAAHLGFAVTATDIAPTALGAARDRAGTLPILFVLDDITRSRLDARYDVVLDRGLLHCLPRAQWAAYSAAVTARIVPGGALLVVAHQPGVELATTPVTDAELRALLPGFELVRHTPTTLSRGAATLFELARDHA